MYVLLSSDKDSLATSRYSIVHLNWRTKKIEIAVRGVASINITN
jgi:hypothetical protein